MPENPGWHIPYTEIAPRLGDIPLLCFVRNPWDWYVSFYHYNRKEMGRRPESWAWKALFDEGKSDFKQTVTRVLWPGRLEEPSGPGPRWYREFNASDLDLYSWWHQVVAGQAIEEGRADVGRFESPQAGLSGLPRSARHPGRRGVQAAGEDRCADERLGARSLRGLLRRRATRARRLEGQPADRGLRLLLLRRLPERLDVTCCWPSRVCSSRNAGRRAMLATLVPAWRRSHIVDLQRVCRVRKRGTRSTFVAAVNLSICAIYRDEAPYLREWVEFHRLVGGRAVLSLQQSQPR